MLFLIPLSPYSQCSYGSAFCYYRLIYIFQKSSCFLGIIQHVLCFLFVCVLVWLVSLRIIILRFIHVVASIRCLILFIAESYFIVLQFIHSTIQLFFKINFYWSIVDLQHCQFLLYRKVRQLYIYTSPLLQIALTSSFWFFVIWPLPIPPVIPAHILAVPRLGRSS